MLDTALYLASVIGVSLLCGVAWILWTHWGPQADRVDEEQLLAQKRRAWRQAQQQLRQRYDGKDKGAA